MVKDAFPWLQVGVPCKRLMDTVTVKCGHCNHLSFLSPRPLVQSPAPTDYEMGLQVHFSCITGRKYNESKQLNQTFLTEKLLAWLLRM
ncbi:hypothetical protein B296_00050432 [Ensete ventricosum]|uniref:YABBY N-terminal domain-containing protein n=1 Tax=Ensete ventricosum TaxID=4639 RepID=A0A426YEN8_ENSVE|nr:hypothetical protein B296_00050432 [Ensete ventricosum]